MCLNCCLCRALKKMCDEGVLVAGAPPGRKGAGCFKVSQEEKSRLADAAKAAAKKLKAEQKQSVGKVLVKAWKGNSMINFIFQAASKAPKKVAKKSAGKKAIKGASAGKKAIKGVPAGKKVVKGASAGKKISVKKSALGAKKPIAKSSKAVGKKGAAVGAKKKVAPKSIKAMKK